MNANEQLRNGFALVWGVLVLITLIVCIPVLPQAVHAASDTEKSTAPHYIHMPSESITDDPSPETDTETNKSPESDAASTAVAEAQKGQIVIPCRAGGEDVLSLDSILTVIFGGAYHKTSSSEMETFSYSFDKEKNVFILGERAFYDDGILAIGNDIFLPEVFAVSLFSLVYEEEAQGYTYGKLPSCDESYYSNEDLKWLSAVISAEARGEVFSGKIAVGNVVLNRVRSPLFPNTVKDVVFDTKGGVQFSPVKSGSIYREPTEESILAAKVCLEGASLDESILFFYNPSISSSTYFRENRTYVMTVGNHDFFS